MPNNFCGSCCRELPAPSGELVNCLCSCHGPRILVGEAGQKLLRELSSSKGGSASVSAIGWKPDTTFKWNPDLD